MSMRACAFFSPSLDPVLDRGKGDKDAVVAPEVPTRRAVGQAVLDHEPYRQINHAVGVLTARWRQIGEVRIKVLATLRTVVLRIGDHEITRTPQVEIPQVVQRPLGLLVPIGLVTTTRTRVAACRCDCRGRSLAGGRSAIAVIPSVGSGRYAPGPNMALSSLLACWGQNYTINAPREPYQNPVKML